MSQRAAAITKHPVADRGRLTITYWLLHCKYILLVSSESSLLSSLWMFSGGHRRSANVHSTMAGDKLEIPLAGFSGRSQEETHNLSIRCHDFPRRPQPADPFRPLRGSPPSSALHRAQRLSADPMGHWPAGMWQFFSETVWRFACAFWKELT